MKPDRRSPNVNVTLSAPENGSDKLFGKTFPCPVCAASLGIRMARTGKPYCVCMACGIQLFFRGKLGIARLRRLIENELLIAGQGSNANVAEVLFNRIQHLKQQRTELNRKQRLIFPDPDLENAIRAVDNEIKRVQGELEKRAHPSAGRAES